MTSTSNIAADDVAAFSQNENAKVKNDLIDTVSNISRNKSVNFNAQHVVSYSLANLYKSNYFKCLIIIGCLLVLFKWYFYSDNSKGIKQLNTNKTKSAQVLKNKIHIAFGDWKSGDLESELIEQLQNSLVDKLTNDNRITLHNKKAKPSFLGYEINAAFTLVNNNLRATLSFEQPQTNIVAEQFSIDAPIDDTNNIDFLSTEIAAALRLMFFRKKWFEHYRGALDEFTYSDLEQLINIDYFSINYSLGGSIDKAVAVLDALERKYPTNAYLLGFKAKHLSHVINNSRARQSDLYHQRYQYIKKALAADPANLDALTSLYHYYNMFGETRNKAEKIAELIIHYHPNKQAAWRTGLVSMINSTADCNEIHKFLSKLPIGVFSQWRLQAINRILNTCTNKSNANLLFATEVDGKALTKKQHKALINNVRLFGVIHDYWDDMLHEKYTEYLQINFLIEGYIISLKMGDKVKTDILERTIAKTAQAYEMWVASLYAQIHQRKGLNIDVTNFEVDYQLLGRDENLYLSIILAHQAKASNNRTKIQSYLDKRPLYDVSIANRYATMSRIIALRANGETKQSQKIASRLFNKLEAYRQQYEKSYHFYRLGFFQLASAMYCESQCIDINLAINIIEVNKQLNLWFGEHHKWWFDDANFVKLALTHLPSNPYIVEYIARIEKDRYRLKDLRGF